MNRNSIIRVLLLVLLLATSLRAQVVISNVYTAAQTATTETINWTTNVAASSQIRYGYDNTLPYNNNTDSTLVTSHSMTLTVLNNVRPYYFAVVSVDGSGHSSQSSTEIFSLCNVPTVPASGIANNYYQYGTYSMTWVPPSGSGASPTVCGVPVQTTVTGTVSGGGSLSGQVADSYMVIPGPGQWQLTVRDPGDIAPITVSYPFSAVSNDVSPALMAAADASGLINCQTNTISNVFYPGGCGSGGGGPGTVTDFTAGNLVPLFTTSVANPTTTPALSFTLSNAQSFGFYGNVAGSTGPPSFVTLVAGSNITLTPAIGTPDALTIAASGGGGSGITGLTGDCLAGDHSTACTVVMVHAVQNTKHLTIDSALTDGLAEYYTNSATNMAYSLYEDPTIGLNGSGQVGPAPVFEMDNLNSGVTLEHSKIFPSYGLNFYDDNSNGDITAGGSFWFLDAPFSPTVTTQHYISLQTTTGNTGDDNVQIISGGETSGTVSGGAQRENYILFPRNVEISGFKADTLMLDHIFLTGGDVPCTSNTIDFSSGASLQKIPACTINNILPPFQADDNFFNASAVVYMYADAAFTTTNSGNIVSAPFTATVGQLYMALYYGGTGDYGGSPGVWRIYPVGGSGSGGSNVTINGGSTLATANFSNTTPAAGTNGINVSWQNSGANISAEIVGDGNAAHFLNGTGGFSTPAGSGTTTNALTMNNSGAGASSGTTFNGSAAVTLSYNTLGAAPLASPTFTGTVTIPALTLSGITGSTQCLQVNSSGVVSGTGSACGSGGSTAWSALTNPTGNLALTMGADTSTFTFGATTGSSDLFALTDTASNTGTGIMFHPHTQSGSTEIPFQADANGVGCQITATGAWACGLGSSVAGTVYLTQGTAPGTPPTNSLQMYVPTSVTAYNLVLPGSQPTAGNNYLFCTAASTSLCSWSTGGGTSTIVASAEVVASSSTPTFSTSYNVSRIVLTSNITTFTLGAGSDGQDKTLCFKQGSGPYTVSGPSNVHGFFTVGTVNAEWNCQTYVYDNTDSIWQATTTGVINQ